MYMRMFSILQFLGQRDFALEMQRKALARQSVYRIEGPSVPRVRLLALMGPGDMMDNTPLEFVLENSDIRLDLLFLQEDMALPEAIPDHDIAIVAVSDSDKNRLLLTRMEVMLAGWPRPVLNRPKHIIRCERESLFRLMADVSGLLVPVTRRCERARICECQLPTTIRPRGSHAGKGLARLDNEEDVDAYLEQYPDEEFYVAEYVDYRGDDGVFRKLRVVLIDGRPYVCHLAISGHWVVHYHSASMHMSDSKRGEEAALMHNFDDDFALRHSEAFSAIAERLDLDYVVLDCGETRDGRLLLFEADIAGWIHAIDPSDIFPYKQKIMQKAFDAFRTMLLNRAVFA